MRAVAPEGEQQGGDGGVGRGDQVLGLSGLGLRVFLVDGWGGEYLRIMYVINYDFRVESWHTPKRQHVDWVLLELGYHHHFRFYTNGLRHGW